MHPIVKIETQYMNNRNAEMLENNTY